MIKMQLVSHGGERIARNQDKRERAESADEWIRGGAAGNVWVGHIETWSQTEEARGQRDERGGGTSARQETGTGTRQELKFEFWQRDAGAATQVSTPA